MKLLMLSLLRFRKQHGLQTLLTAVVAVLITGMVSVLLLAASGFQKSMRTCAWKEKGSYHYKYCTMPGSAEAEALKRMAEEFQRDSWFSDVRLLEDEDQVELVLTAAHPGFFTSKIMKKKFDTMEKAYYIDDGETSFVKIDHNYELLASYGDLSKENGIYAYLVVFLAVFFMVSISAVFVLGAVFTVGNVQRERDFALLSGIGAGRGQMTGAALLECAGYCVVSIPAGFFLGIAGFCGIRGYFDRIIDSLFGFPPAPLVVSLPGFLLLCVCASCIITLSGLLPALKASKISPVGILSQSMDIKAEGKEAKDIYAGKTAERTELWLGRKSYRRFRRRNRAVLSMLVVTFMLCFVLDGVRKYALQVIEMAYETQSYDLCMDLSGRQKKECSLMAEQCLAAFGLKPIKEAVFYLHSPYPFTEEGKALFKKDVRLPDVSVLCIDGESWQAVCEKAGIDGETKGMQGIFINAEHSWWEDGVKVRGRPFSVSAGEKIMLFDSPDSDGRQQGSALTAAGIVTEAPLYTEIAEPLRMQILVSEQVFSKLEEWSPDFLEQGLYRISLRGEQDCAEELREMAEKICPEQVTYQISDYTEEKRQEKAAAAGFEILCAGFIFVLVLICVCGNVTVSFTVNKSREREFAVLLSLGMGEDRLKKMRYYELLCQILYAFLPGTVLGLCCYQVIYHLYTSEYQIRWQFPLAGFLLGGLVLTVSAAVTDRALRAAAGRKTLSEQLRSVM